MAHRMAQKGNYIVSLVLIIWANLYAIKSPLTYPCLLCQTHLDYFGDIYVSMAFFKENICNKNNNPKTANNSPNITAIIWD